MKKASKKDQFDSILTVRPIGSRQQPTRVSTTPKPQKMPKNPPESKPLRHLRVPQQLVKMPLSHAMKMIEMKVPRFGKGDAIVPTVPIEEERRYLQSYELSPNDVLNDVQKEIDISANQLKEIQTILVTKKMEDVNPVKKTPSSKDRVVNNLNVLNKKLEDMQDRYFRNSKAIQFKAIDDIEVSSEEEEKDDHLESIPPKNTLFKHSKQLKKYASCAAVERDSSSDMETQPEMPPQMSSGTFYDCSSNKAYVDACADATECRSSIFDDPPFPEVMKSSFLMKTFDVVPKRRPLKVEERKREEIRDLDELYRSLNHSLKNSFYTPSLPKLQEMP